MEKKLKNLDQILNELDTKLKELKNLSFENREDFDKKLIELSKAFPELTELIYFIIYLEDKNHIRDNMYINAIIESLESSKNYKEKINEIINMIYEEFKKLDNKVEELSKKDSQKLSTNLKNFFKSLKAKDLKIIGAELIFILIVIATLIDHTLTEKLLQIIKELFKYIL